MAGNTVATLFIGNLKLGDNICYNMGVVTKLYKTADARELLIKPKFVQNVSIIEALMIDFVRRVKMHTREFQYFDEKTRVALRNLKSDQQGWNFKESINKFRHYNLLGRNENLYQNLLELRELRNRIHIQNTHGGQNESDVWTRRELERSEVCTEFVLKYLSQNFPRPLTNDFVGGLTMPWKPHFDPTKALKWRVRAV